MDKESFIFDTRIEAAIADKGLWNPAALLSERLVVGGAVATVRLGNGRDTVLMAAIASCLVDQPGLRCLVVTPGEHEVAGLKAAFDPIARAIGTACVTIGREGVSEPAPVIIGSLDTIASSVAAGTLDNRSFGLIALSNIDTMANAASVAMLRHALGPASTRRRFAAFCTELGPAHRAIVRDLGGSVVELELEAQGERAKSSTCLTYTLSVEDKPRLLLGLLASEKSRPVALFCDLRETAEATAKFLRANGVRTEFVLGNLARKAAILGDVIGGAYDVLVLTDEGARGLPRRWAAMIVNWDLPLEGEPYLSRLEHLNTELIGASIYNFACERYSYGIPAIEKALGHGLKAVKVEESMMVADLAITESRPRVHSDRQVAQPNERGSNRGSGRPRGDDSRDHGGQYDGRNARAIQADIAAITGGKPLRDIEVVETAKNQEETASRGKRRGKKSRANGTKTSAGSKTTPLEPPNNVGGQGRRRDEKPGQARQASPRQASPRQASPQQASPRKASPRKASPRKASPKQQPTRQQAPRQQAKRPKAGNGQRLLDPYSVSMEERLRLYRERYGEGFSHSSGSSQGGKSHGGKPQAHREGGASRAKHGDNRRGSVPGSKPGTALAEGQGITRARPQKAGDLSDDTPVAKGMLASLRNMFSRKED